MQIKINWVRGLSALLGLGLWSADARPLQVDYRVGLRYDDNHTQRERGADKKDSFVIFNQLALDLKSITEGGFAGLRYSGTHTWYDDRAARDADWDHSLTLSLTRAISPRLNLALGDTLSYVQSPGLIREDGAVLRLDSTYLFNTLNASLAAAVTPSFNLDVSGRHAFIRYDANDFAEREDYDLVAAGLVLRSLISREFTPFAEVRLEDQDYRGAGAIHRAEIDYPGSVVGAPTREVPDRGSDTLSLGLGANHMFSPTTIASVRAGYMRKEFNDVTVQEETAPYGEASLTVVPVPSLRVTVSASHSQYQSSLITFVNQERNAYAVNLAQDIGPRLTAHLGASHIDTQYDAAQAVGLLDPATVMGGNEDASDLSVRLSYRLGRMNYFEAGYSFTDMSSELREDFTRNRYDLSWHIRF